MQLIDLILILILFQNIANCSSLHTRLQNPTSKNHRFLDTKLRLFYIFQICLLNVLTKCSNAHISIRSMLVFTNRQLVIAFLLFIINHSNYIFKYWLYSNGLMIKCAIIQSVRDFGMVEYIGKYVFLRKTITILLSSKMNKIDIANYMPISSGVLLNIDYSAQVNKISKSLLINRIFMLIKE